MDYNEALVVKGKNLNLIGSTNNQGFVISQLIIIHFYQRRFRGVGYRFRTLKKCKYLILRTNPKINNS